MSNTSLNAKMIFVPAHPNHCSEPKFTFLWETWPHLFVRGSWLSEEMMALVAALF